MWYWRASFQAVSTASEPPETKNARVRSPGASSASSVEGELAHLLERGLPDLLAVRVADVHCEEARERVEVALAGRVLEIAALAADDHRHVRLAVAAHAREVEPEVVLRRALELLGREALERDRHVAILRALCGRREW